MRLEINCEIKIILKRKWNVDLNQKINILLDSLQYVKSSLSWVYSRSFSVPCATFSMLGHPSGTGCNGVRFPVHGGWDSRDVSVVGVCNFIKENGAHDSEKLLLKTQVSDDFA